MYSSVISVHRVGSVQKVSYYDIRVIEDHIHVHREQAFLDRICLK